MTAADRADYCHVSRVHPHPGNIRSSMGDLSELAASITVHGILQPIVVQPHPQRHGHYVILAGHRRHAAAKLAGVEEVPITVRPPAGAAQAAVVMLVENCQRADLSPVEKAEAMGGLAAQGWSQTRIAGATGLSGATVSYYFSLLDLNEASRERVRAGTVQVGRAVGAVRDSRAATRRSGGRPARKVSVPEDHFSYRHPLADEARLMCQLAGHAGQKHGRERSRSEGKIACGQCWETVIRDDERSRRAAPVTA